MREEANPRGAWADPLPAVWITLCSVMLFLLLNRWAEATVSSLSASETSFCPSKGLRASVKGEREYFAAQCTNMSGAEPCFLWVFKMALS